MSLRSSSPYAVHVVAAETAWKRKLQGAARALDRAREERDALIVAADQAGEMTQGAVAEAVGLSRMQVSRIVKAAREATPGD